MRDNVVNSEWDDSPLADWEVDLPEDWLSDILSVAFYLLLVFIFAFLPCFFVSRL